MIKHVLGAGLAAGLLQGAGGAAVLAGGKERCMLLQATSQLAACALCGAFLKGPALARRLDMRYGCAVHGARRGALLYHSQRHIAGHDCAAHLLPPEAEENLFQCGCFRSCILLLCCVYCLVCVLEALLELGLLLCWQVAQLLRSVISLGCQRFFATSRSVIMNARRRRRKAEW